MKCFFTFLQDRFDFLLLGVYKTSLPGKIDHLFPNGHYALDC